MVEEIRSHLYRVVVPLPGNPLKEVNSYILTSPDRNLIIDTGMNRPECREVLEAGLDEIGVDLERTDFISTHLHADHQGLISTLMRPGSKVYMGALDTPSFTGTSNTWAKDGFMGDYARRSGFPQEDLGASMQNHPGFKYSSAKTVEYIKLQEGDAFTIGDYHLTAVHTPGHTNGHMCLYDADRQIFFSGDHVLGDITPNIASWSDDLDPLDDYLTSLAKVDKLDVELCLPGHRSVIQNYHGRIEELVEHHRVRANEVIEILESGDKTAYDTAGQMTWHIRANSWQEFPLMQRWFATGEAIAHLIYIEGKGLAGKQIVDDLIVYSASGGQRL